MLLCFICGFGWLFFLLIGVPLLIKGIKDDNKDVAAWGRIFILLAWILICFLAFFLVCYNISLLTYIILII